MAKRSHRHRKFNRYTGASSKRKRGFSPYLIILFSAIAAVLIALILGNALKDKIDGLPDPPKETEKIPAEDDPTTLDAQIINGIPVTLKNVTDNTYYSVLSQIPSGTTAVSLTLFNEKGAPYYSSSVAAAFDKPRGELTLGRVFETVGEETYASVIFPSEALMNTEEEKQTVLNAYEVSLIKELYEAGADDVIITLSGEFPKVDDSFIERLSDMVHSLRHHCDGLRIGISLPPELATDGNNALALESLSKTVDILALDLTEIEDQDSFTETLSRASINILRREMRLLIRNANEKELLAITETLDKYEMRNRQVVAK